MSLRSVLVRFSNLEPIKTSCVCERANRGRLRETNYVTMTLIGWLDAMIDSPGTAQKSVVEKSRVLPERMELYISWWAWRTAVSGSFWKQQFGHWSRNDVIIDICHRRQVYCDVIQPGYFSTVGVSIVIVSFIMHQDLVNKAKLLRKRVVGSSLFYWSQNVPLNLDATPEIQIRILLFENYTLKEREGKRGDWWLI